MLNERFTPGVYARRVNNIEIGRRLKSHREASPKVSLEKLSKATGGTFSPSRISNYEQGLRALKPRDAETLASAFGKLGKPTTAIFLLGLEGKSDPALKYKDSSAGENYISQSLIDPDRMYRCYDDIVRKLLECGKQTPKDAWDPKKILGAAIDLYNFEIRSGVQSDGMETRRSRGKNRRKVA